MSVAVPIELIVCDDFWLLCKWSSLLFPYIFWFQLFLGLVYVCVCFVINAFACICGCIFCVWVLLWTSKRPGRITRFGFAWNKVCCIIWWYQSNGTYTNANTQADAIVQIRTHLLILDFGSSTRGERHDFKKSFVIILC